RRRHTRSKRDWSSDVCSSDLKESTAVFQSKYSTESKPTAISEETLGTIVDGLTRVPEGFHILPKVKRMLIDRRRQIFEEGGPYRSEERRVGKGCRLGGAGGVW